MASGDLNMPSLDNVYDLTEKLSEEGIEYILISVQKGKKENRVDVMLDLLSDDTTLAACAVMQHLHDSLIKDVDLDGEEFSLDLIRDAQNESSELSFEFDIELPEPEPEENDDDDDDSDDDNDKEKENGK
jgi:hypothetical protein